MTRFDDIKPVFWDRDSTYGVQPELTDDAVQRAENVLGVKLPVSLLELLKVRNGGGVSSEFAKFPTGPTSWADDHVPLANVMGIGEAGRGHSLFDSPRLAEEWELPTPVVLLTGDGHYWIALDYRESGPAGEPSVTWFDTELNEELALAANFGSLVEGLRPMESEVESFDFDRPPPEPPGDISLSFAIELIDQEIAHLQAGERSLPNAKLWCRARVQTPLNGLSRWKTRSLSRALKAVERASDEAAAVAAMRQVQQEVEALIPAWIELGGMGSMVDGEYLEKRQADQAPG